MGNEMSFEYHIEKLHKEYGTQSSNGKDAIVLVPHTPRTFRTEGEKCIACYGGLQI